MTTFGWCQTYGRPDQFHDRCLRSYVTAAGVARVCECPAHESEAVASQGNVRDVWENETSPNSASTLPGSDRPTQASEQRG